MQNDPTEGQIKSEIVWRVTQGFRMTCSSLCSQACCRRNRKENENDKRYLQWLRAKGTLLADLNVTSDSFSDGGKYTSVDTCSRRENDPRREPDPRRIMEENQPDQVIMWKLRRNWPCGLWGSIRQESDVWGYLEVPGGSQVALWSWSWYCR